jgi:hypothetical protein
MDMGRKVISVQDISVIGSVLPLLSSPLLTNHQLPNAVTTAISNLSKPTLENIKKSLHNTHIRVNRNVSLLSLFLSLDLSLS